MVDKTDNKLDFCMELGNIVRDHLPKVPKNPKPASWDTAKKQMAVNGKNETNIFWYITYYSTKT